MKKLVVITCTPNSAYDFFLPLAVRVWRVLIGYEPVVVLVGPEREWSYGHAKVVRDEIWGAARVELFAGLLDLPDSTVSMSLRQQISALDFSPDDLILVGDVDLFPVYRDFYHRYEPLKSPIGIYYAEMYKDEYWPAYGVSMPVRNWREVMGVAVGDLKGSLEKALDEGGVRDLIAAHQADAGDTRFWTFDEVYATKKIRASRFVGEIARFPSWMDGREPLRSKLPSRPSASDYVDFHCSRPGWNGENWPGIRQMLAQMIPLDLWWVDQYVKKYRASL